MSVTHSTSGTVEPVWATKALRFWFDELGEDHWWAKSADIDAQILSRFLPLHEQIDCERVRRKPPASLAAYECALKGNPLPWDDPHGAAEAVRLFEKAIEIDPGYGLPHALLASTWQGKWRDEPKLRCRAAQGAGTGKAGRRIGSKRERLLCYFGLGSNWPMQRA